VRKPLTFQAIIIWRDELNEAKILLRDIIDLERPTPARTAEDAQGRHDRAGAAEALAAQIRERIAPSTAPSTPPQALTAKRRRLTASTTKTTWRIPSRSPRWKPS